MDRKDLKQNLHNLADVRGNITPRADFVHDTRENLLMSLESSAKEKKMHWYSTSRVWNGLAIIMPTRAVYAVVRPIVMLVLVFGLATGSWITGAFATGDATEGDAGYFVKISMEKTTETVIGLTRGEVAKKKLQAEHATRRLKEVKQILSETENGDSETKERVEKTVERYKDNIEKVHAALEGLESEEAVELARAVEETTEEAAEILDDAREELVVNTMIPEDVKYIVDDAADTAATTDTKTAEAYVKSLSSGDDTVTIEEVKEVIDKKIKRIETSVNDAVEKVNTPGTMKVNSVEVVEPTKEIKERSDEVMEVLQEAKELLKEEEFTQVIEKVGEVTPITQKVQTQALEVEKVVADAEQDEENRFVPGGLNVENVETTDKDEDKIEN